MASIKLKGDTSGEITIQAPSVAGTNTLNLQASSGTLATTAQASVGTKNLIINGNMRIAQRGTSVSGLQNSPSYLVDRWSYRRNGTWSTASFTYSQISSTGLAYFDNAARLTVTGTETPSGDVFAALEQAIEGHNTAHLDWGTANAKTVTLSFWVRSSLTGTFSGSVFSGDLSASFAYEYTISAANTWEKKTITIAGPTIGTFPSGNGTGFSCSFSISGSTSGVNGTSTVNTWQAGNYRYSTNQTNLAGTSGATFDITGIQLEVGTEATPFENRMYSTELALCQRYYETFTVNANNTALLSALLVGSNSWTTWYYHVTKRSTPTVALTSNGGWVNLTPSIFPSIDNCAFQNGGGYFYLGATNTALPALYASSEL